MIARAHSICAIIQISRIKTAISSSFFFLQFKFENNQLVTLLTSTRLELSLDSTPISNLSGEERMIVQLIRLPLPSKPLPQPFDFPPDFISISIPIFSLPLSLCLPSFRRSFVLFEIVTTNPFLVFPRVSSTEIILAVFVFGET